MDFSVIVPARHRHQSLRKMIESVFKTIAQPDKTEIIVMADDDDSLTHDIARHYGVKLHSQPRHPDINSAYTNFAAMNLSSGKYLWSLTNGVEVLTDKWDDLARDAIESFVKKDRLCYIYVDDGINTGKGCCHPMMTRESCEALGCFVPPGNTWAAYHNLHTYFARLGHDRILRLPVKVGHPCRCVGVVAWGSCDVQKVAGLSTLPESSIEHYTSLLKRKIDCSST